MNIKYSTDDERRAAQLAAYLRYHHSEKGQARQRRYETSEKAKSNHRSEQAKAQKRLYFTTEEGRQARQRGFERQTPEARRAWWAVSRAVKNGRLVRPAVCTCGVRCRLHAHHPNGYDRGHQLDIVWLCPICHAAAHHEALTDG